MSMQGQMTASNAEEVIRRSDKHLADIDARWTLDTKPLDDLRRIFFALPSFIEHPLLGRRWDAWLQAQYEAAYSVWERNIVLWLAGLRAMYKEGALKEVSFLETDQHTASAFASRRRLPTVHDIAKWVADANGFLAERRAMNEDQMVMVDQLPKIDEWAFPVPGAELTLPDITIRAARELDEYNEDSKRRLAYLRLLLPREDDAAGIRMRDRILSGEPPPVEPNVARQRLLAARPTPRTVHAKTSSLNSSPQRQPADPEAVTAAQAACDEETIAVIQECNMIDANYVADCKIAMVVLKLVNAQDTDLQADARQTFHEVASSLVADSERAWKRQLILRIEEIQSRYHEDPNANAKDLCSDYIWTTFCPRVDAIREADRTRKPVPDELLPEQLRDRYSAVSEQSSEAEIRQRNDAAASHLLGTFVQHFRTNSTASAELLPGPSSVSSIPTWNCRWYHDRDWMAKMVQGMRKMLSETLAVQKHVLYTFYASVEKNDLIGIQRNQQLAQSLSSFDKPKAIILEQLTQELQRLYDKEKIPARVNAESELRTTETFKEIMRLIDGDFTQHSERLTVVRTILRQIQDVRPSANTSAQKWLTWVHRANEDNDVWWILKVIRMLRDIHNIYDINVAGTKLWLGYIWAKFCPEDVAVRPAYSGNPLNAHTDSERTALEQSWRTRANRLLYELRDKVKPPMLDHAAFDFLTRSKPLEDEQSIATQIIEDNEALKLLEAAAVADISPGGDAKHERLIGVIVTREPPLSESLRAWSEHTAIAQQSAPPNPQGSPAQVRTPIAAQGTPQQPATEPPAPTTPTAPKPVPPPPPGNPPAREDVVKMKFPTCEHSGTRVAFLPTAPCADLIAAYTNCSQSLRVVGALVIDLSDVKLAGQMAAGLGNTGAPSHEAIVQLLKTTVASRPPVKLHKAAGLTPNSPDTRPLGAATFEGGTTYVAESPLKFVLCMQTIITPDMMWEAARGLKAHVQATVTVMELALKLKAMTRTAIVQIQQRARAAEEALGLPLGAATQPNTLSNTSILALVPAGEAHMFNGMFSVIPPAGSATSDRFSVSVENEIFVPATAAETESNRNGGSVEVFFGPRQYHIPRDGSGRLVVMVEHERFKDRGVALTYVMDPAAQRFDRPPGAKLMPHEIEHRQQHRQAHSQTRTPTSAHSHTSSAGSGHPTSRAPAGVVEVCPMCALEAAKERFRKEAAAPYMDDDDAEETADAGSDMFFPWADVSQMTLWYL